MMALCCDELSGHISLLDGGSKGKSGAVEKALRESNRPISKKEIMSLLPPVSVSTIEAELGRLVKSDVIEKVGSGPATKYRIVCPLSAAYREAQTGKGRREPGSGRPPDNIASHVRKGHYSHKENTMPENRTALDMLYERTRKTPEKVCLVYHPDERMTYEELWLLSGRVYSYLKRMGIGKEDRVLYTLPRGLCHYAAMVGTMRAGAAFILTETGADERTAFIRRNSEAKTVIGEKEWREIEKTESLEGFEKVDLHALLYIAYTSGTTAEPKGVLHEYGSLDNAALSARIDGKPILTENDTFLAMSPLNFVSQPIMFSFLCVWGTTLALMPCEYRESDEKFHSYVKTAGVNSGYLTPSFLRKHYPFGEKWRLCILSSEPADGLDIPGMKVYNCYASTESGCLTTVYELKKPLTPAPVGKSAVLEVFILREDGTEAERGEKGEVVWRNAYVRGYLNLPEKTRALLRGRVFHSGDSGEITEDGNLILHGRTDECFKIGGYRIEPEEVAGAVRKVCPLEHFVVRGFVYKDISSIIVFYTDSVTLDEEDIHNSLLKLLPEYMVPTSFVHLDDFPLLSTGKLDKLALLPPEGNWENFRTIRRADLKEIGRGRTASVYDMGDRVLKLFRAQVPYTLVNQEKILTSVSHDLGVTDERAYEIVRSGASYGIILDKLKGDSLENLLASSPEKSRSLIGIFASGVKRIHSIHVPDDRLPDMRKYAIALTEHIAPSLLNGAERGKVRRIFEVIPERDTFVLGDCHPGNAIISRGRVNFIDFLFAGKGHCVFDLVSVYSGHLYKGNGGKNDNEEENRAFFEAFMKDYAPSFSDTEGLCAFLSALKAARTLIASAALPGFYPKTLLMEAKKTALEGAERLEKEGMTTPSFLLFDGE